MDAEKIAAALAGVFAAKIEKALEPLMKRLDALENIEPVEIPDAKTVAAEAASILLNGEGLKSLIDLQVTEAMAEIEIPAGEPGRDGVDGKDGKDGTDGRDGLDGEKGLDGKDGLDGQDGVGLAGCLIDRENSLVVTLTNGTTKNLGVVVGRDGIDGKDGQNGVGITDLVRTYDSETHEIVEKWGSETLRYPAGGISHGGYWREGVKAIAGQTWTHGGTCWIAKSDTDTKPTREASDWEIFAQKGRDGLDYKHAKPAEPVKLNGYQPLRSKSGDPIPPGAE